MIIPYLKIAKWIGVVIVLGIVSWILYAGLIRPTTKPNPSTKQEATTIINHNYSTPKVSFGCQSWRIYERKDKGDIINDAKGVKNVE